EVEPEQGICGSSYLTRLPALDPQHPQGCLRRIQPLTDRARDVGACIARALKPRTHVRVDGQRNAVLFHAHDYAHDRASRTTLMMTLVMDRLSCPHLLTVAHGIAIVGE